MISGGTLKASNAGSDFALIELDENPRNVYDVYFNGFDAALSQLQAAKPLLYKHSDEVYALYKESMRILRKAKYS